MPFGLTNVLATFQRLINQLFSGEEWKFVFVYLDDTAEQINVSRQRLSRCSPEISTSTPWVGHAGKMRKRRKLRWRRAHVQAADSAQEDTPEPSAPGNPATQTTQSGREIHKPTRFLLVNSPEDYSSKSGEVVRHVREDT